MRLIVEEITEDDYENHRKDFKNKVLKSFIDDYEDTLKKGITRRDLFELLDKFTHKLPKPIYDYIDGWQFRDWAIDILKNTLPDKITTLPPETTTLTQQYVTHNFEQDFVVPQGIEIIGEYAFNYKNVKSISIPNSVKEIKARAFSYCKNLTNVTMSDSVTSIGNDAFDYCSNLKNITIPESVTKIEDETFYNCNRLTNVTMGNNVTSIGVCAFYKCYSLKNITIPDKVTSIGKKAFYGCNSLTNVEIPPSVTSIGEEAFRDCDNLISITIPSSVTTIGWGALYFCDKLKEFIYTGTKTQFKNHFKNLDLPDNCNIIYKK